jgi:hypothetical protein
MAMRKHCLMCEVLAVIAKLQLLGEMQSSSSVVLHYLVPVSGQSLTYKI